MSAQQQIQRRPETQRARDDAQEAQDRRTDELLADALKTSRRAARIARSAEQWLQDH